MKTLAFGAVMAIVGIAMSMQYFTTKEDTLSISTPPVRVAHALMREGDTHYDHAVTATSTTTVREDVWVTEFSAEVQGAPHQLLHNFYLYVDGQPDTWCPDRDTILWSGGTVSAQKPSVFEEPYGILLEKGTVLRLESLFVDEGGGHGTEHEPSLRVNMRTEPAAVSKRTVPLTYAALTPAPCDLTRPIFRIDAQARDATFSTERRPFIFPSDGRILRTTAHFHASYERGIVNTLRLFLNGSRIDEFASTDVANPAERNPTLLKGESPFPIKKNDVLWMEAVFNNPSDTPVAEGMAIVSFYFAPEYAQ